MRGYILKGEYNFCPFPQAHGSQKPFSVVRSMVSYRRGVFLVACRAHACGRPVDRPADNGAAH